jgi:hypothetical protein
MERKTNTNSSRALCDVCPRIAHTVDYTDDGEAFRACLDHVDKIPIWIADYLGESLADTRAGLDFNERAYGRD